MIHFNSSHKPLPPADSLRDEEQIIPDIDSIESIKRYEDHVLDAETAWDPIMSPVNYNPPNWFFMLVTVVILGTGIFLAVAP